MDYLKQKLTAVVGLRRAPGGAGGAAGRSRVAGADAEAAHQQLGRLLQHVPNFALSFLYQLLICLIEDKNLYF